MKLPFDFEGKGKSKKERQVTISFSGFVVVEAVVAGGHISYIRIRNKCLSLSLTSYVLLALAACSLVLVKREAYYKIAKC